MPDNIEAIPISPVSVSEDANQKTDRPKPSKTLPTTRIQLSKQLDILRAYAAASAGGTKAATINEVAVIVKMATTTVSLANAFLSSMGLIVRSDAGAYTPSSETLSYLKVYGWSPDTAAHKLAPVFRDSWFGQVIVPRATYGSVDEETALIALGEAANATTDYRKELRVLLDFLAACGVIQRDGGQIKLLKQSEGEGQSAQAKTETIDRPAQSTSASRQSTQFASQAGGFNLHIDIHVDMSEFSTWRPDRIQSFFRGVAEVLAAKADVEKGGTQS